MNYIEVLDSIDAAVWGPPMIILLLGCHIYTTIRTKGIQRKLPLALKLSITKDNGAQGDVKMCIRDRLDPARGPSLRLLFPGHRG